MRSPGVERLEGKAPSLRARLLQSCIDGLPALGYELISARAIAAGAGVTEADFQRCFVDKDQCCGEAFESICDRFSRSLLPIYLGGDPPFDRIRAAAYAAAHYCCEHEQEVIFILRTRSRFGSLPCVEESLSLHLAQLDSLRHESSDPARVPASAAEFCLGAFLELAGRLGTQGRLRELPSLVSGILYNLAAVYLGRTAAEQELARQTDPGAASSVRPAS